jgi:hypothetical protein
VYLHFLTLEEMNVAKETLTTQSVADYKLTVTVCWLFGGAAGFEDLSHVKRRPTSKWNAVADLAGPDILRSVY